MSASPFTLAGRYRLTEILGEGGMGRVWAAHDLLLSRQVAIKEMAPPPGLTAAKREELRGRVIREARAIARVDHPNVVRVIDVLHERGEPWIVMELVASRSLFEEVRREGPLTPEQAAEVGLAVLRALRAAHASGLLHRDVKPANVLLGVDGRVVLTDFGLASVAGDSSITATGVILGSPSYLAPERVLDEPIGPAADLWSLGATLYAAVEGKPPYSKSSPMATLAALAGGEPLPPPTQAGVLAPALEALLRRDPAQRADAATAERLLRAAADGRMVTVGPAVPAGRSDAPSLVATAGWSGASGRTVPVARAGSADPGAAETVRTTRGGRRWKPFLISLAALTVLLASAGLVLRGRAEPVASAATSAEATPSASALAPTRAPAAPPPSREGQAQGAPSYLPESPSQPNEQQAPAKLYRSGAVYQLVNPWAKDSVIELPGGDTNTDSGTRVQLFRNLRDYDKETDQYWKIVDTPGDGYVNIINEFSKLSLGIENASKENHAKLVQVTTDRTDHNQQWSLRDAGNGQVHIFNRNSGRVVELLGDDLGPPKADGSWDGYWVEHFDLQAGARDQEWVLAPDGTDSDTGR